MKLLFDARVLIHRHYTGVENYTKSILNQFQRGLHLTIAKPRFANKYLAHLWLHVSLPFQKGELLFCPANTAPIFVPKNKKLILTLHDVAFLTYPESFSKVFQYYYQFLVPRVIKRANKIITISETSKREILRYYPYAKGKIEVIALGVDDKFKVLPDIAKEKIILYVGSLNLRKNFISVISAFQQLNRADYKLIVVGNFSSQFSINSTTKQVVEEAKKNPNIIFKSHIDDNTLVKIYNQAELLLFPSFYEGFGLPPLEAMACGTPVLTSNISSMPEVCADAALYCNPHDIDDITSKISLLLEDKNLQEKMREKGLLHVKKFTWDQASKKHLKVFKSLLS